MVSLETIMEDARADSAAVTQLATILAKQWCEQWGGWPEDTLERAAQIWAFRPSARRQLAAITKVSKTDRNSLARAIAH